MAKKKPAGKSASPAGKSNGPPKRSKARNRGLSRAKTARTETGSAPEKGTAGTPRGPARGDRVRSRAKNVKPAGSAPGKGTAGVKAPPPVTPPIEKVFYPDRWNNTEKIILARRSVRCYRKEQVPEQMIRRILECGRYAPSEGNYQPWRYIVVRDPKVLKEMEADAQKAITRIWKVINYRDHPWRKYHTMLLQFLSPNNLHPIPCGAVRSVAEGQFNVLWGAPTAILLLKDKRGIGNPDLDIGITGTNMVIAAHSMGLGTCWIGIISVLMLYDRWRKLLNIRYPWYLEQALLVGYPVGDPDGFVHRETHAVDWIDEGGHRTLF